MPSDTEREEQLSNFTLTVTMIRDEVVRLGEGASQADVLVMLDRFQKGLDTMKASLQPSSEVPCRWCGHPVAQQSNGRWAHRVDGEWSNSGCRAASYDRLEEGWDDSLDRSWQARPPRQR